MSIKSFDVMNLGKAGLIEPEQMGYKDSLEIIKDESFRIQKSFVKIGWYLKHIRDNELYKEDGYTNIYECAADQLGYSQSTASRFINICEKFSKNNNSPEIDEKYEGFDKSQMIEMLPMELEQLEKITPDMTVRQIRDIKSADKAESSHNVSMAIDDNIPGQTSIENDFPEYMPDSRPVSREKPESYEENECSAEPAEEPVMTEKNNIIDGNYHEMAEPEEEKPDEDAVEMPEENDIQRNEWLNNYKTWGLWYHDEHIDVNYYKFDFSDGSRLIVAEYPQRTCFYDGKLTDEHYYHLLERNKKGYGKVVYDEKYRYSSDGKAYIVDFLKNLQKKE